MEPRGEKKLETFAVQDVSSSPALELELSPSSLLWKQTRTRRLFSGVQLYAFMLIYLGTWAGVAMTMYFAMQNGGPATWLFSYIVVAIGTVFQVTSFTEMASIMPVAGAQYYWTYCYAPPKLKLFLTWVQGWTTWLGYIALMVTMVNSGVLMLEGIINLADENYPAGSWRTLLLMLAVLLFASIVNMWFFAIVPAFEFIAGIVSLVLFVVVLSLLWAMAPRNSPDIFLSKSVTTGWDQHYFIAFNIGTLSNIFLFVGFESLIHMGEETRHPKKAVPQALFWGVITNIILGMVMIFTWGICMPSVDVLLASVSPMVTIVEYATGSAKITIVIFSIFYAAALVTNIGGLSSISRLTWAWARDGGLPVYFGLVDGKTRVPMRAIIGTVVLSAALSLVNLSGEAYVAFGAMSALTGIAIYVSYAIVLSCMIYSRLSGGLTLGEWNWGRFGIVFNILAWLYTVWEIIFLPFPNILPVTATNMNYAGPIYVLVLAAALSWWIISARHTWKGPNMKVMEIVLRNDEMSGA